MKMMVKQNGIKNLISLHDFMKKIGKRSPIFAVQLINTRYHPCIFLFNLKH